VASLLMVTMIYPDPQTAHVFVRQRQDAYELEASVARLARPLLESRRLRRRRCFKQLRLRLVRFVRRSHDSGFGAPVTNSKGER
jgi:hypothetical protein